MRARTFLLITAAFFGIVAVAAAISGGISWAVPVVLVAGVVAVYALTNREIMRRDIAAHGGDEEAALRDGHEGGLPKVPIMGDEHTALGDTPDVHSQVSAHDFPKGAPERRAAERQGARHG